jgi:hypothetical protein
MRKRVEESKRTHPPHESEDGTKESEQEEMKFFNPKAGETRKDARLAPLVDFQRKHRRIMRTKEAQEN